MGTPIRGAVATTVVAGAVAVLVTLGGCGAFPQACPAIGWTNTVEVRVPGSAAVDSPVHEVAFCGGTDCTPGQAAGATPPPAPGTAGASAGTAPTPAPGGSPTAGPEPTAALPFPTFGRTTEHDGETWRVMTEMGTPDRGRVALRDDAGATLTERVVDLTWTRHGGSEQCGGPSSARTTVRP